MFLLTEILAYFVFTISVFKFERANLTEMVKKYQYHHKFKKKNTACQLSIDIWKSGDCFTKGQNCYE